MENEAKDRGGESIRSLSPTQAHTPLPWAVSETSINGHDWPCIRGALDEDGGWTIALIDQMCIGRSDNEPEANAALIVRAVNSHEALVKAVRKAVNLMSYLHWESDPHGRKDKAEVYAELSAALENAERDAERTHVD